MKNSWTKKGMAIGIILLFVGTCIIPSIAQDIKKSSQPTSRGNWLYVGGSGPGNYTKIQDAVNDSINGDTVFVYDGSSPYYENIVVDKSIHLIGENKTTTIIECPHNTGDVVSVHADGVTIREFSIQNSFLTGSEIATYANQTCISHIILRSTSWYGFGILLFSSCDSKIVGNSISNKHVGILLLGISNNNTITENDITNNSYGVEIETSSFNHIYYNNFINNTVHASDTADNTWNSEYPSAGNYWDNYTGLDAQWGQNQDTNGSDGVGDTLVSIPGGENQDRYPLMEPYTTTKLAFGLPFGGFGISGKIKNVGDTTAYRVCWRGTFTGGFIPLGRDTLRVIPKPLLPGEEAVVKAMILGFGKATLTMMFWADNAPCISSNCSTTVLLFFIIGINREKSI